MITKRCTKCGLTKPLNCFTKHKLGKGGIRPTCRECCTKEEARRRESSYRAKANDLFHHAKFRAKKHGLPITITTDWIETRLLLGVCEVTGIKLDVLVPAMGGQGTGRAFGPSLDRTNRNKGYTPDNVKVVCWIYNRAKGVDGHDAVMHLVGALA